MTKSSLIKEDVGKDVGVDVGVDVGMDMGMYVCLTQQPKLAV